MKRVCASSVLLATMTLAQSAFAGSLQVAPVLVEVPSPSLSSTVQIRNEGAAPLNAQIRVFKWTQTAAGDQLVPTNDVLASPPVSRLPAGANHTIRLVRTTRAALNGEESYRILIDELPDPTRPVPGTISLVMRHSVPVFFRPALADKPHVAWSVERSGGRAFLAATNMGGRRLRVAGLSVRDANGASVTVSKGLAGYVLSHSSAKWELPGDAGRYLKGPVKVSAQSDAGEINETASVTQR